MTDRELVCEFTVFAEPKSKGRPRFGKGRAYTSKADVAAETAVLEAFNLACPLWEPSIERLALTVWSFQSHQRRADLDNRVKLIQDALNGVAYVDDEQIDELHAYRRRTARGKGRTLVRVEIVSADS